MNRRDYDHRATATLRPRSPFAKATGRVVALSCAVLAFSGVAAAAASADTVATSVQSAAPEQGVPLTLNFTGSGNAIDSYGDGPYLYAVVRPTGGIGCQSSFGADQAAAGGVSDTLTSNGFGSAQEVGPGNFSWQTTYTPPDIGTYLVCAWVEKSGGDESGNPYPPSKVTAGPVSSTFATRGPQVGELTVSLPSPAQPNVAYQINYTTQTDQQLTLDSVVKPAGGLPCASSFELEQQQNQSENNLFNSWDGNTIFGGPVTTTATDTESNAGPYVICTWIEGPNNGEVDAALTNNIYVGTPPTPPPPPSPPAPPQCVVPRYAGLGLSLSLVERRLINHHCTIGHIHYVYSRTHRGLVLWLSAAGGRHLGHNAPIGVFVSAGRRRRHHHTR